jgi:hypothetical protein
MFNFLYIIYSVIEQLTDKFEYNRIDKNTIIEYIEPFSLFQQSNVDMNLNDHMQNIINISNEFDKYIEEGYLIQISRTKIMINKNNESYSKYLSIKKLYINNFNKMYSFMRSKYLYHKNIHGNKVLSSDSDIDNVSSDISDDDDEESIQNNKKNIKTLFKKINQKSIEITDAENNNINNNYSFEIEDILFEQDIDNIDDVSVDSIIIDDVNELLNKYDNIDK